MSNSQTFSYVSAQAQTFTVPTGVTAVSVSAAGAQGAAANTSYSAGQGALVTATLPATPGDRWGIFVGAQTGWPGGGGSFNDNANGGGCTAIVDLNTGALLLVAGGGGGSDGSAAGGNGGQSGTSGAGSVPGGGATQSGGGTSPYGYTGSGPATGSTGGFNPGGGGGASSGGGGGYYGGGGGGQLTTGTSSTQTGWTSNGATSTGVSGNYLYPDDGSEGPGTNWTQTVSGNSDPTQDNGATWVYNQMTFGSYEYYQQSNPSNTQGVTSWHNRTWNEGGTIWIFSGWHYSYQQWEETFSPTYSTSNYTYVGQTGSGGGGSSFTAANATDVSVTAGSQAGNGTVTLSWSTGAGSGGGNAEVMLQ